MIRIVGLGPEGPDGMSVAARDALRAATGPWDNLPATAAERDQSSLHPSHALILRTERHPAVAFLAEEAIPYTTCDDLYERLPDFAAVYDAIADRIMAHAAEGDVTYAVPGHPCVGEEAVRLIVERAKAAAIPVEIVGSPSFIEPTLAAVSRLGGSLALPEPLLVVDALTLADLKPTQACTGFASMTDAALLIYQVYDRDTASAVKLALLETRPDDHEVVVVRSAGMAGSQAVERIPLRLLDRIAPDHLTSVYVPAVPEDRRVRGFADLVRVMARLRSEDGCPWDRKQDHGTLRKWLLEECYEAVEAIDEGDLAALCDELGDVMLQIVFHAQVATESGAFTIADVIEAIVTKLVRRHPHVFGDGEADTPEDVVRTWEAIKRAERAEGPSPSQAQRRSALDGVPPALPALSRAQKTSARAAKVGFDWPNAYAVLDKVAEEHAEIRSALESGDMEAVKREIGDLLFAVVNLARWTDVDAEEALREMLQRFVARFHSMEEQLEAMQRTMDTMTIGELDELWESAKRDEAARGA